MDKILIVDDDVEILQMVKFVLTLNKFAVETVSHWQEINTEVSNFKPDLVLMDISLGGVDGRTICKELHFNNETKDIPVILFSANCKIGIHFEQYHAKAFIQKPFTISELVTTIKMTLE